MAVMIKPSSATPPHLRKHRLSLFDQTATSSYVRIIFFYSPTLPHLTLDSGAVSETLKQSLSDTLAIYYPLAGSLRDDHVECNDAGAEYLEATFSNERISDAMMKAEERARYVPSTPSCGGDIPLAIQASFFGCSGMAIGFCVSHKVADARSIMCFVNRWAMACRGDLQVSAVDNPTFEMASRFPPIQYFGSPSPPLPYKDVVKTRAVFDAEKIAKLKAAASGPLLEKASSVEAVSAFIWSRLIEAVKRRDNINGGEAKNKCFAACHTVDLRSRASPPLPPHSFGNAAHLVVATTEGREIDYYSLAMKLREQFRKVDESFVRKFEDGSIFAKRDAESEDVTIEEIKEMEFCLFTSWWKLPAYEADYGWGKPAAVATLVSTTTPVQNMIALLGTTSGDGIEALINLDPDLVAYIDLGF